MVRVQPGEHGISIEHVTDNLRRLTADGQPKAVVQHVQGVYGDLYGEAKETAFTAALRALVKAGEVEFVTKGTKPHFMARIYPRLSICETQRPTTTRRSEPK